MTDIAETLEPHPERHNHLRFRALPVHLIRLLLLLEIRRLGRSIDRWLTQVDAPGTDDPGVAAWIAMQLSRDESHLSYCQDLLNQCASRVYLDTDVVDALTHLEVTVYPNPPRPSKRGRK